MASSSARKGRPSLLEAFAGRRDSDTSVSEEYLGDEMFKQKNVGNYVHCAQILVVGICWLTFTYFLMVNKETEYEHSVNLAVPAGKEGAKYSLRDGKKESSLCLRLYGPFKIDTFKFDEVLFSYDSSPKLVVVLQTLDPGGAVEMTKSLFHLHLAKVSQIEMVEKVIEDLSLGENKYQLHFVSNINETIALQLAYEYTVASKKFDLIFGMLLLVVVYMALMFELVHYTVAGVVCSTLAIGIMAAVQWRPPLAVIFNEWGNIDTIMLYFGTSLIIELLSETGLQDRLAAHSFELANGHIWPMLHCVILATCLLSNLFDVILLMLFIAPICLRLCEIMQLNCTPVLSALIIAINVGSTWAPTCSLTNNLIANSPHLPQGHMPIEFKEFASHMLPATLLALAQSYIHLRLQFRDSEKMRSYEPLQMRRLKHLIKVWRLAAKTVGDYTWDDSLARQTMDRRVVSLRKRLKRLGRMPRKPSGFEQRVQHLHANFPLRKIFLMIVCLLSLVVILLLTSLARFFVHLEISKGWVAIFAALFVLSLTSYKDIDGLFSRIDWGTMLFFITLSIIMQVIINLGLLENIGLMLEYFITSTDEQNRLAVTILLIIWISALLTTFIDNVPVADMMMRIIGTLSLNENIDMPIMPLVWSVALGCSLGGNGSIVANVANIACASVASRHGYKLRFIGYYKIGFFVMLGNIVMASVYLLLAHVYFQWH